MTVDTGTFECGSASCLRSVSGLGKLRSGLGAFVSRAAPDAVGDVKLAVDELLTNALVHGQAPVRVRLQLRDGGQRLWIEVSDDADPRRPTAQAGPNAFGRQILDALCTAWGMVAGDAGRTMWADLPLDLSLR